MQRSDRNQDMAPFTFALRPSTHGVVRALGLNYRDHAKEVGLSPLKLFTFSNR